MTASLIFGIVCVIVLASLSIAITVLVSHALSDAFRALDRMHVRSARQVDGLLDRLQTVRWEDLVALRANEEPEVGGFLTPDEQEPVTISDTRWGHLSALKDRLSREEQQMLDEDFPEETVS